MRYHHRTVLVRHSFVWIPLILQELPAAPHTASVKLGQRPSTPLLCATPPTSASPIVHVPRSPVSLHTSTPRTRFRPQFRPCPGRACPQLLNQSCPQLLNQSCLNTTSDLCCRTGRGRRHHLVKFLEVFITMKMLPKPLLLPRNA